MKTNPVTLRGELVPAASISLHFQPVDVFGEAVKDEIDTEIALLHARAWSVREAQGYAYDEYGDVLNGRSVSVNTISQVDVSDYNLEVPQLLAHVVCLQSRATYRTVTSRNKPSMLLNKNILAKWKELQINRYLSGLLLVLGRMDVPGTPPAYDDIVCSSPYLKKYWAEVHQPI